MNPLNSRLAVAALSLMILSADAVPAHTAPRSFAVSRSSLCVTEGEIRNGPHESLIVDAQKMRAYINTWTSQSIEAEFTYVGPTAKESALAQTMRVSCSICEPAFCPECTPTNVGACKSGPDATV